MPYKQSMDLVIDRWEWLGASLIQPFNQGADYIDDYVEGKNRTISGAYVNGGICKTLSVYWLKYYPSWADFYAKIQDKKFKRGLAKKDIGIQFFVSSKSKKLNDIKETQLIKGSEVKLSFFMSPKNEYCFNEKLFCFCQKLIETPISSYLLIVGFHDNAVINEGFHAMAIRINMVDGYIELFDPNLGVVRITKWFPTALGFVFHDLIRSFYKHKYASITATQYTSIRSMA